QKRKLSSLKRRLNHKCLTPWEIFKEKVDVVDRALLKPQDHTHHKSRILIWNRPIYDAQGITGLDDLFSQSFGSPNMIILCCDMQIEKSGIRRQNRPVMISNEDLGHLQKSARNHGYTPLDAEASLAGPVDSFIDHPPYQQDHHLKLRTDAGVITSAIFVWSKTADAASQNSTIDN
ncbi:MAG: hypothetical protein OJI67_03895, partial [Prosthecobacter sp.]|nr:hypothetical protein [Prosthecobacter sp.]